ncbi:MAG: hypothetical protein IPH09_16815 [bacterium]|nr:hypothetical protein [bacterium]
MFGKISGKSRQAVALLLVVVACGCGDDDSGGIVTPPDTCSNMGSASYEGTEDVIVTSGSCSSYSDLAVTFTIVQAAGSCDFALQNSLIPGTVFSGTVSGTDVTWSGSYPLASGTVTIDSVDATLSADLTSLTGSFDWSYAGSTECTGTTTFNVMRQ